MAGVPGMTLVLINTLATLSNQLGHCPGGMNDYPSKIFFWMITDVESSHLPR